MIAKAQCLNVLEVVRIKVSPNRIYQIFRHRRKIGNLSVGGESKVMVPVFRLTVFFALITSVFAGGSLDALVTAAQDFSVAIQEQLAAVQSDISACGQAASGDYCHANFRLVARSTITFEPGKTPVFGSIYIGYSTSRPIVMPDEKTVLRW